MTGGWSVPVTSCIYPGWYYISRNDVDPKEIQVTLVAVIVTGGTEMFCNIDLTKYIMLTTSKASGGSN